MTSKFEGFQHDRSAKTPNSEIENLATDSFELLSAYIDGELSPTQSNQVKAWIDEDPKTKQVYIQLLTLQGQMQHSVAPPSEKSVAEITAGVFKSIDRTRHRRRKLVWGGSAIAAAILATTTGIIPGISSPGLRMAEENPANTISQPIMLAVAVNKPAINIPKAATGYGIKTPKPIGN